MNPSAARSVLAAAGFALLAGCSSMNPFAPKVPKPDEPPSFQPKAELRSLWQVGVGAAGTYDFRPAVVGEVVYAAGQDGTVVRIEGGRRVWSADVGAPLSAGVGSDGKTVAVVTVGGDVVALEAASGKQRWRSPVGAEVLSQPGVSASKVVVRASDHRIFAFDAASGERSWVYRRDIPPLALRSAAGMRVDDQAAVIGFPGGKLVGINLANGGPLWEITVATPRGVTELERVVDVAGVPAVSGKEVCAVAFQGRAGCFDVGNGRVLWSQEFSSSAGLDRSGPLVFVTAANDSVQALKAEDGASVWKQAPMKLRRLSAPLAVGSGVVFGDFEGYVHALDTKTGGFIARSRANGAISVPPVRLGENRFVVQTQDGSVQAFELN